MDAIKILKLYLNKMIKNKKESEKPHYIPSFQPQYESAYNFSKLYNYCIQNINHDI